MKKASLFIALFLLFALRAGFSLFAQTNSESISVITYYPSPFGSYQQLKSKILELEASSGPPSVVAGKEKQGMLYYDTANGLQYWDSGQWVPLSGQPADTYDQLPEGAFAGTIQIKTFCRSDGCYAGAFCNAVAPGKCRQIYDYGNGLFQYAPGCESGFTPLQLGGLADPIIKWPNSAPSTDYTGGWTCIKQP